MATRWQASLFCLCALGASPVQGAVRARIFDDGTLRQLKLTGASALDIAGLETVQVSPHYAYLEHWRSCLSRIFSMTSQSTKGDGEVAVHLCSGAASQLQSYLAKSIGFSRSVRVVSLLEKGTVLELEKNVNTDSINIEAAEKASKAKRQAVITQDFSTLSTWHVRKINNSVCAAFKTNSDATRMEMAIVQIGKAWNLAIYLSYDGVQKEFQPLIGTNVYLQTNLYGIGQDADFNGRYHVDKSDIGTIYLTIPFADLPKSFITQKTLGFMLSEDERLKFFDPHPLDISQLGAVWEELKRCLS